MSTVTRQLIDLELGGADPSLTFTCHDQETMSERLVSLWGESESAAAFIEQLLVLADQSFTVATFYGGFIDCIRKFYVYHRDPDALHILLSVPMVDLCFYLIEDDIAPHVCADYLNERLFSLMQSN